MRRLIDLYPRWYRASAEFTAWQDALDVQTDAAYDTLEDLLNQVFVSTATWGLNLWEKQLGIITDISKGDAERREIILSKLRTRPANLTVERLTQMIAAFGDWGVEIDEQYADYTIQIKFTGKFGVPAYMDNVDQAVRQALPAHLDYVYAYTYPVWNDIDAMAMTWIALDEKALTWDDFDEGGWVDA